MYDVVVIGSGAGGLHAAARLSHAGYRTLVVEGEDRVGGRATTREIDGFKVNEGAIALEFGGAFQETFDLVGAPFDVRRPPGGAVFKVGGKMIDASKGGWGLLLGGLTKHAAKVGASFSGARRGELPEESLTTAEWLGRITRNRSVHRIFHNLCGVIFAGGADEVPARTFLIYLATKGAFKDFGFCPQGTIGLWNALAEAVTARGGEVWLSSPAQGVEVVGGAVAGVTVRRGGGESVTIACRAVVSNAGPAATVALAGEAAFAPAYLERLRATVKPASLIVVNFASRRRLMDLPSLVTFAETRRLCNLGDMTATCPELAPPGWSLYVAYAVPQPSIADFDEAAEIALTMQDLANELPGFETEARILSTRVMRGGWPAQRSLAGYDMPLQTPVAGLWNVGDAVKPDGDAGTQACAVGAATVAAEVARSLGGPVAR